MSLIAATIDAVERLPLPDVLTRAGVALLVGRTRTQLDGLRPDGDSAFAESMAAYPIATHTTDANAQHYEVPAAFFGLVLGPQRKYSCCLYRDAATSLAEAETAALRETATHAGLVDGQSILELGCGWGSLSLFMATSFPKSKITAVSNSASQKAYIDAQARLRGLSNLRIVTADMNQFEPDGTFDRVVSVEMFEHMSNWQALLQRVRTWLEPQGRLFVHVFTHRTTPYRFDHADKADWIAQHFFTGGIMPSHGLIHQFPGLFDIEAEWRWSGRHYQRTADDWLRNFDRHDTEIRAILRDVYGPQADLWRRRWRLFFLATSGLFGHDDGQTWGVSSYRLRPMV